MKRIRFLIITLGTLLGVAAFKPFWSVASARLKGKKTVDDRLREYGSPARSRLAPHFKRAGINYPPKALVFVGIKNSNRFQIYGTNDNRRFRFIAGYPILKASGAIGPKLREGDLQVPEGIYRIEALNPNSSFHLSLRVNYPNAFDREQAKKEGRTNLGGDIMIHGSAVSIGCLAMGDQAAEDLFVLAADTGINNITVLLTPVDFRTEPMPDTRSLPSWISSVYQELKSRLAMLPPPEKT